VYRLPRARAHEQPDQKPTQKRASGESRRSAEAYVKLKRIDR
jgi:hypothetical protein